MLYFSFDSWLAKQGVAVSQSDLITSGTKIIQLKAHGVTVRDTFCFMPFALSAFPKTFALDTTAKGEFPYMFDTAANQNYVGPWPDIKYYTPDQKKPDERKKFLEWYEEHKNKVSCILLLLLIIHS